MTTPTKDTSRNDRLSISYSHKAEHVLRQELGQRALRRCDGDLKAFAECAKEQVRVCGNEGGLVGGAEGCGGSVERGWPTFCGCSSRCTDSFPPGHYFSP